MKSLKDLINAISAMQKYSEWELFSVELHNKSSVDASQTDQPKFTVSHKHEKKKTWTFALAQEKQNIWSLTYKSLSSLMCLFSALKPQET